MERKLVHMDGHATDRFVGLLTVQGMGLSIEGSMARTSEYLLTEGRGAEVPPDVLSVMLEIRAAVDKLADVTNRHLRFLTDEQPGPE